MTYTYLSGVIILNKAENVDWIFEYCKSYSKKAHIEQLWQCNYARNKTFRHVIKKLKIIRIYTL